MHPDVNTGKRMSKFGERNKKHVKNVLVLGNERSGKRSFLFYYKDGINALSFALPEIKTLSFIQYLSSLKDAIIINFVLDGTYDKLTPSTGHRHEKFDAVLILIDLSSASAQEDLKFYSEFANIHFKKVETLLIGTKADIKCIENEGLKVISTSVKTGEGFAEFKRQLQWLISPVTLSSLSL